MALEQRPGESNLWFDRLVKFCLLGSGRSIDQCFRDEMVAKGRERSRVEQKRAPGAWREKVKKFEWWERSAEYDKEQRRLALEQVQAALDLARNASLEAMQFQIDLMRGKVAQIEGVELIHRRLASNSLLNRVGAVFEGLTVEEEDGAVQVVGIRINAPRPTGSDK